MKLPKNNRPVIVGIFIVFGLAILVAAIFTLGGQKKTFVKSFALNAIFNDVGGLSVGANIWFSGMKVGTVKKIGFYGDSKVNVTMSIDKEAETHIHINAKAKIGSDGLIGNKIVIIYGGDSTTPQVEINDYLIVENVLSTDDMLATLQLNNKNLVEITNSFKVISKKIESGDGTIAMLLNDKNMATKLNKTVGTLQTTIDNFKSVSLSSKTVLADVEKLSGKINTPGNSINDLVSDTLVYRQIVGTVAQLKNAATSLNKFTANLKIIGEQASRKNNSLGVILNDTTTANALKNTIRNLESGSQKLDADLEALQHNFLLRGFFKKKAKENEKLK
jgi:phospholipid/cholesterol/gamma-HCH transport system substrate-binding protein